MIDNEKIFNSLLNEVKKYLAHLQFERNMSSNTTESYYLDLKYYIEYIVFDKNILNEYCDSLKNFELPIFSFDSFYRNASREKKLRSVLGARYGNLVSSIWHSFSDNFLDKLTLDLAV